MSCVSGDIQNCFYDVGQHVYYSFISPSRLMFIVSINYEVFYVHFF